MSELPSYRFGPRREGSLFGLATSQIVTLVVATTLALVAILAARSGTRRPGVAWARSDRGIPSGRRSGCGHLVRSGRRPPRLAKARRGAPFCTSPR